MTNQRAELDEKLIASWVKLTGTLKNTRITHGMIYNEAVVMMLAYYRYREDGAGLISFKEIVAETKMLKSLVNRTIDSLVAKGFLVKFDGEDKRTTFVKLVPEKLDAFLAVHRRSVALADSILDIIGMEDAEAFIRIADKVGAADPLNRK